jgi:hypothetical protein
MTGRTRRTTGDEFEVGGIRVIRDGTTTVLTADPSFDRELMNRRWTDAAAVAAGRSDELVAELRELVDSVNALHLVGQVASWLTVRSPDELDDPERYGSESRVEFLAAVAVESGAMRDEPASPEAVRRVLVLLRELFMVERARILGEEVVSHDEPPALAEARFTLRLESLEDRTQGYEPHLVRIVESVFERIRSECEAVVGFCPGDVVPLVHAYAAMRQAQFDDLTEQARQVPVSDMAGLSVPKGWALLSWIIFVLNDPTGDFDAETLAEASGVQVDQLRAMLPAMTTPWGQPPSALRPGQHLTVRRRSVLAGEGDRYTWPLPWSSIHEMFPWFNDVIDDPQFSVLKQTVSDARADGTEELTTSVFRGLFGEDHVHPNFEYPIGSGNWAEADIVVRLPGHALAVECKSGALDDLYRYGDIDYAHSTFKTFIEDPFRQSARAATFLTCSDGKWRTRSTRRKHDWVRVPTVTRIAVSLERIDPLSMVATRVGLSDAAGDATWVVCLADLLLIAEILDTNHTFFAYAKLRAELAANPSVAVISEADLLGAFLHDRLRHLRRIADKPRHLRVRLTDHARELNRYFTAVTLGLPPPQEAERPHRQEDENSPGRTMGRG